ncbi:MAG TPA: hypothetical protein VGS20_09860 [Candidatus Acidoferrales bacterium]|nr:hypothetical protein [Candidatus Acidoferrales bacterium]
MEIPDGQARAQRTPHRALLNTLTRARSWPWFLAAGVLVSRVLTTGSVYFAD